jgi:hypothetical protein
MNKLFKSILFSALSLASQASLAVGNPVSVYTNNPTYIPNNVSATATLSATGTFGPYSVYANDANARINITGTFTGLVATVYITSDSGQPTQAGQIANYTWSQTPVTTNQGQFSNTISASGLYSANVSGANSFYINVFALSSGSVSASISEGLDDYYDATFMGTRAAYHASIVSLAPAASATDFVSICGSSSKTIAVTDIILNGQATTAGSKFVQLAIRTTADTGGTSSSIAAIPSDTSDVAATATVLQYTANPTSLGTSAGYIRSGVLSLPTTSTLGIPQTEWQFGSQTRNFEKEIILRGANQCLTIHGGGASFPTGATLFGSISWTEY